MQFEWDPAKASANSRKHEVSEVRDMKAEYDSGVPYQSLINLYLRDCLANNRRVEIKWPSAA